MKEHERINMWLNLKNVGILLKGQFIGPANHYLQSGGNKKKLWGTFNLKVHSPITCLLNCEIKVSTLWKTCVKN